VTSERRERIRKTVGIVLLILAVVVLVAGARRSLKAYEADSEQVGILTFQRISERQLVEDSTFAGVIRKDGRLYSTYDRSQPREGKRACPT